MNLDWLKLIQAHKARGGLGLTLPFLLGALRHPIGSHTDNALENQKGILNLLASMRDQTPSDTYVSLTICDRLNEPVFTTGSSKTKQPESYARLVIPETNNCHLYVTGAFLSSGPQPAESLLEKLWERHGNEVMEGRFSWYKGQFRPYIAEDISFITRALHHENMQYQ